MDFLFCSTIFNDPGDELRSIFMVTGWTPGREARGLMNHSFRINSTRNGLSMLHQRESSVRPYVFLIERMTCALFFPGICVIKSSYPRSRNKRHFKIPGARKLRVRSREIKILPVLHREFQSVISHFMQITCGDIIFRNNSASLRKKKEIKNKFNT